MYVLSMEISSNECLSHEYSIAIKKLGKTLLHSILLITEDKEEVVAVAVAVARSHPHFYSFTP